MRLGQLARKLALRPVEIVDFLARNHVQIDPGNNTRIEDEHVVLVLQKFAPGELIENVEKAIAEEEITAEINVPESVPAEVASNLYDTIEAPVGGQKIEVIKAPKIELSGLKVLGKIELPETKKKEKEQVAEGEQSVTPETDDRESRRPAKPSNFQRRERSNQATQRSVKNPIAAQREREAREAELKRKEELERNKEKRTLHYLKKVNVAQPVKAVKVLEEKEEKTEVMKAPVPTTVWGRFKRWLRS